MSDDLLVEYLRQLMQSHRTPEVTVAWQGGEPTLMDLDFFRRALIRSNNSSGPNKRLNTLFRPFAL
jgi:uncharacterized protein